MGEMMSAVRIKDGKAVVVQRINNLQWLDTTTNEVYYVHIDIDLLY